MPDGINITFSDDEALKYVQQLENPRKVGWDGKKKVWRTPKQKGYDKNQIAYGLDTRKEHNPIVYNFLKLNGRLSDPWLTDKEAKQLMALTWDMKKATMSKIIDKTGGNMSLRGYNVAAGMIWHGHPAKMMLTEDSVTGKAFNKAIASGDRDLNSVFDAYYNYGSNATQFADRIKLDEPFRGNIKQIRTRDGNKILKFPVPEQKPFKPTWKPEPPVKTIYPLNNTTPESISSWSGADAPNATPRLKDLLEVRQEDLNRGINVYGDPVSPFSLHLRLPSLTGMLQLNSPLKLAELYFADILGISDMVPLTPSLFPRLRNGKLPGCADGNVPGGDWYDNLNPFYQWVSKQYNIGNQESLDKFTGDSSYPYALESVYNTVKSYKPDYTIQDIYQEANIDLDIYDAMQKFGYHTKPFGEIKPEEWLKVDSLYRAGENTWKKDNPYKSYSSRERYADGKYPGKILPRFADGNTPDAQLEIVVTPKKRSKGSLSPKSAAVTPDITTEFDDGITRDQILDTIYTSNANGLNTYNKEQFFNKYGISADENSEKYYKWLGGKPFLRSKTRREILSDKYKLHIGNRYGQYAQDVADAINYINGYYKSPQYLDRIAGNAMDPVDYVAEAKNFLALYEPSGGPAWQHSNDHENTFYIPMTSALFDTAYPDKEYDPYLVAAHEYAHYMLAKTRGVGDNAFNGRDKNLFDRRIDVKYPKHDTNYNENYADLMATRADMYRRGYVDKNNPYGEITLDAIKDYRSKYGLNNRFFDLYNDEDIRSMYNTIAQNQYTQDNSILYARDGKLPGYSNGKPIRIKPANRGKLTRLKKRTGKSESELYNDGNPAHRKMVVFARNARKWKH